MRYQLLICLSILLLASCATTSKTPEKPADNSNQKAAAPATAPPAAPESLLTLYTGLEGWMGRVEPNRSNDNNLIYITMFLPRIEDDLDFKWIESIKPGTPFTMLSSGRKIVIKVKEYLDVIYDSSGAREILFTLDDTGSVPKDNEIVWLLPAQVAVEAESIKVEQLPKKDGNRREWRAGSLSFYYQKRATFQADLFLASSGTQPVVIDKFKTNQEEQKDLIEYIKANDFSGLDLYKSNMYFDVPVAAFKLHKPGPTMVIFEFYGFLMDLERRGYKPMLIDGKNRQELEPVYTNSY